MGGEPFDLPPGRPGCVAGFRMADGIHCYAEPVGVGSPLPDAPLFYDPAYYVNVPL